MMRSLQAKFNNSIVTALLFNTLSLTEKERKVQEFVNDNEERYNIFCDNIYRLFLHKGSDFGIDTLYLTIDGFSFISCAALDQQISCFPVLSLNNYASECTDISKYIEIALNGFEDYCKCTKNAILPFDVRI